MASTPSARIAALDDVAFAARAIAQFMNDHPEMQELLALVSEYETKRKIAADVIKNIAQTEGTRRFTDENGDVSGTVDKRQDLDGDALIRDHGSLILLKAPRALKVTKSELMKVKFEGVNLEDYLENPQFIATVTSKDKGIKTIAEKMKYLLEALNIDAPESPYELEQWYQVEDDLRGLFKS